MQAQAELEEEKGNRSAEKHQQQSASGEMPRKSVNQGMATTVSMQREKRKMQQEFEWEMLRRENALRAEIAALKRQCQGPASAPPQTCSVLENVPVRSRLCRPSLAATLSSSALMPECVCARIHCADVAEERDLVRKIEAQSSQTFATPHR